MARAFVTPVGHACGGTTPAWMGVDRPGGGGAASGAAAALRLGHAVADAALGEDVGGIGGVIA